MLKVAKNINRVECVDLFCTKNSQCLFVQFHLILFFVFQYPFNSYPNKHLLAQTQQ